MERNIKLLNYYSFFGNLTFTLPIILLFFNNELELNFEAFILCQSIFGLCVICFEVPSGYVSDKWNRKHVLFLSGFLFAAACLLLAIATNIYIAILAHIVIALSTALQSGTVTAYLYEILERNNNAMLFKKNESWRNAIGLFGLALASIMGAHLYMVNPYIPIFLTAFASVLQMGSVFYLKNSPHIDKVLVSNSSGFKDLTQPFLENKALIFLFISGGIVIGVALFGIWLQQEQLIRIRSNVWVFGYVIAFGILLSAFSSLLCAKIDKLLPTSTQIISLFALSLFPVLIGICFNSPYSVVLLLFSFIVNGYAYPFYQTIVNDCFKDTYRATALSFLNLMSKIFFILCGLLLTNFIVGQ